VRTRRGDCELPEIREIQRAEQEAFERLWHARHDELGEPEAGRWQSHLLREFYGEGMDELDEAGVARLEGTLSTLRWVLGDEWGNLDT
jgi:hypothetical protein